MRPRPGRLERALPIVLICILALGAGAVAWGSPFGLVLVGAGLGGVTGAGWAGRRT